MLVASPGELKRLAKIEHEKHQNEVIDGLLNNFGEELVEGDNLIIDDCIQAPIKIEIHGKPISQATRQGYNHFKNYSFKGDSVTDAGITVTLQENGKVLVNGTSTKEVWFEIMYDLKSRNFNAK